jgi:hypothetical protein
LGLVIKLSKSAFILASSPPADSSFGNEGQIHQVMTGDPEITQEITAVLLLFKNRYLL